ncbi:hypothetical protein [Streptomyces sp. NPDC002619]|uniref:hypothetical protein n=1 Tax=Streptomyces sp. NPDC002619 TaxID=3364655 RepID=UPI00369EB4C5
MSRGADVTWLTENGQEFTVRSGKSATVTVTYYASVTGTVPGHSFAGPGQPRRSGGSGAADGRGLA